MTVRPLVLCGPSGAGKSTLMNELMTEFKDHFGFSVSHTTRSPRVGEEDGKHYHFVNRDDMAKAIEDGEFIETAEYSGNLYGTTKKAVEDVARDNKICILDIDMQGVISVKQSHLNPYYVFIKPPTIEDLELRLRSRGTETEASLRHRLSVAANEIEYGERPGNFDIIIINDDVKKAYEELKEFMTPAIQKLENGE